MCRAIIVRHGSEIDSWQRADKVIVTTGWTLAAPCALQPTVQRGAHGAGWSEWFDGSTARVPPSAMIRANTQAPMD